MRLDPSHAAHEMATLVATETLLRRLDERDRLLNARWHLELRQLLMPLRNSGLVPNMFVYCSPILGTDLSVVPVQMPVHLLCCVREPAYTTNNKRVWADLNKRLHCVCYLTMCAFTRVCVMDNVFRAWSPPFHDSRAWLISWTANPCCGVATPVCYGNAICYSPACMLLSGPWCP
jgi:hypothetical protein